MAERFTFEFDPRYRWILRILFVTPARARVDVDEQLRVRFGPWYVRTPVANVSCCEVTGPYRPHRAIGPHTSLVDRGLSFGSSVRRGLCIRFHQPVRGADPLGILKHPGLTVTVDDPEGLARALGREVGVSPA